MNPHCQTLPSSLTSVHLTHFIYKYRSYLSPYFTGGSTGLLPRIVGAVLLFSLLRTNLFFHATLNGIIHFFSTFLSPGPCMVAFVDPLSRSFVRVCLQDALTHETMLCPTQQIRLRVFVLSARRCSSNFYLWNVFSYRYWNWMNFNLNFRIQKIINV